MSAVAAQRPRRPPPRIAVAPMIDVTDRHFRMMIRCISPLPVLYTEMTWDRAILYNAPGEPEHDLNRNEPMSVESIIGFSEAEQPLVMQLGGAEPAKLARAAAYCVARGYEEINLNCGCPAQVRGRSKNCYGVRLMFEPERVAECCAALIDAVGDRAEVTVKCRLGVDNKDSWEELVHFVRTVAASGVRHFIVHARKAILGLNTMQNRSVPPLRHEWVFKLVAEFPHLYFTLNGGVASVDEVAMLLGEGGLHGVMLGRRSNADPYLYSKCGVLYSGEAGPSRREALEAYAAYTRIAQAANWEALPDERVARSLLTPLTGLFHNTALGPRWRRHLTAVMSDGAKLLEIGVQEAILAAVHECAVPIELLDERPSLKLERLSLSSRVNGWVAPNSTSDRKSGGVKRGGTPEGEAACGARAEETATEAGIDADGRKTAVELAFVASLDASADGESLCSGGMARGGRSGKGQEEMEAVLEAEERGSSWRRRLIVGALAGCAVGVLGTAAVLVSARGRARPP